MITSETPASPVVSERKNARIMVFDSGAGGLSIAKEILAKFPACNLVYLADNGGFPYGTMPDSVLENRILRVLERAVMRYQPDIVVVACNTASTLVLDRLRTHCPFTEFVGVVPAIKPAATVSKTAAIGLLATPATVYRTYTDQLINDFAKQVSVYRYGSSKLVDIAEHWLIEGQLSVEALQAEIDILLNQAENVPIDTVVLACTHFPLLKPVLSQLEKFENITWVDSGEAIANRVDYLLNTRNLDAAGDSALTFAFTRASTEQRVQERYCQFLGSNRSTHFDTIDIIKNPDQ